VEIQGTGLLARAFAALDVTDDTVTVFARGVADSRTTAAAEFERESRELQGAIEACRAAGRTIVYLSGGGAIYGRGTSVRREDDIPRPDTSYGRHQLVCEQAIRASGVDHLIARIPNAVGRGQRSAQLVPALVEQVRAGRVAVNPGASRDLIDAADVARLVHGLLGAGARSETVNVASGISTGVDELVAHIERLLDTTAEHVVGDAAPDPQRFSIERLQSYIPAWRPAADYPVEVLERYVGVSALDRA
jgi:nucleoside-diphosphate-sugar epimerase